MPSVVPPVRRDLTLRLVPEHAIALKVDSDTAFLWRPPRDPCRIGRLGSCHFERGSGLRCRLAVPAPLEGVLDAIFLATIWFVAGGVLGLGALPKLSKPN